MLGLVENLGEWKDGESLFLSIKSLKLIFHNFVSEKVLSVFQSFGSKMKMHQQSLFKVFGGGGGNSLRLKDNFALIRQVSSEILLRKFIIFKQTLFICQMKKYSTK